MTLIVATARRRTAINGLHIVVDGSSVTTANYGNIGTLDVHLMMHEPLASSGATHIGLGVGGETWLDMAAAGAEVDAAFDPGRVNVLVTYETSNSLASGRTAAQVLGDITAYTAGRKAAHPEWLIVWIESLPYGGSSAWATLNADKIAIDAAIQADPLTYGFDAFAATRTHPAFDHDGTTTVAFTDYAAYWHETGVPYAHPTDEGKAVIAPGIAQAVADLAGL